MTPLGYIAFGSPVESVRRSRRPMASPLLEICLRKCFPAARLDSDFGRSLGFSLWPGFNGFKLARLRCCQERRRSFTLSGLPSPVVHTVAFHVSPLPSLFPSLLPVGENPNRFPEVAPRPQVFRPPSVQLKGKISGRISCKRYQTRHLEFFIAYFGTRRSMVQIHSPRPT